MRIKEIEARLAAIKQDIEARGESMTAEEINALEQETTQLTEERAGLIAAAEKHARISFRVAEKPSPPSPYRRGEARLCERQRHGRGGCADADRERDYQQGKETCADAE